MSLMQLPYELVALVIRGLDLDDIRNLSCTCKGFRFLIQESEMAKRLLETRAPHSAEARDARASKKYASGLRRLLKRREALASVSPYLVAVVGFAQEWIYENGVLCYCRGRELRLLDLHRSADAEIVVDLRTLVRRALPDASAPHKHELKLLYYSHGIVSCLYSLIRGGRAGRRDFLIAFDASEGQVITAVELQSTSKLFVRNNDLFLYYGTTTGPDQDGDEYWAIRGFDITASAWIAGQLNVPEAIGTDIGSTVCFEIIDGYFYGLSNLRSLAVEEVDWVSYYSCFRFPLKVDGFASLHALDRAPELWRRDHTEGPLDDRWTFLRLLKDEGTGRLMIIESRKEWLEGSITPRRTYYTSLIGFDVMAGPIPDTHAAKRRHGGGPRRWPRDPHLVHPGDDNSAFNITLARCPLRSYYPACQTFIDLVDDSSSSDPREQKVRIRGGTRRPWTPGELTQSGRQETAERGEGLEALLRQIDRIYRSDTGLFWPPDQEEDPSVEDPALADLYAVLNPPGYVGNLHGSWDERSTVYATGGGGSGGLSALVFVSWDPAIYLAGVPAFPGNLAIRRPGSWAPSCATKESPPAKYKSVGTARRHSTLLPDATSRPTASPCSATPLRDGISGGTQVSWRRIQPAMYREISRGYHFAL
ncbi:hypothetical protein MYCTH_2089701 [Thermothelomyces thermophilus ATCC 42464]|uniref:F-box domain-containing protein n=1 Tax=Thermothelomyces thermophilus (strain ATCC 42464 / BCRC 31852 / DSM 1799) TaxID=573729 RepID=G2QAQ0_THET4|nr:uncharacterized protein MYCTH_2089701 [Thermothelomyces thermophilus ATCC 42464]AEO55892.1 hypothetical protein MYCTH_2089701 [Thermothelomyces thermophilus ATCC 42464]